MGKLFEGQPVMNYTHKLKGLKMIVGIGCASMAIGAFGAVPKPPQFAQCSICHQITKGAASTVGPNLFGIGSRGAGKLAGFNYSPAMKAAGGAWNRPRLVAYITDPRKAVPGNRMAFPGIKDPKAAGAVADYLLSLK